ncbi:hypothetical protein TNCV_1442181 [Trichonephila clavipes]|uniref:Uncharacterized protein n=1 Tax=Trichonephila clavipes TaxID=2585209 RepID=A0A8X6RPV1_TRICX|nr:hypothetical protein TNCV_1442181 [Trichonephila clavipes]
MTSYAASISKIVHPEQPLFAEAANVNHPKCSRRPLLGKAFYVIGMVQRLTGQRGCNPPLFAEVANVNHPKCNRWLFGEASFVIKAFPAPMVSSIIMGVLPGGGGGGDKVLPGGGGDKAVGVITGNGVDRVDTGDSA